MIKNGFLLFFISLFFTPLFAQIITDPMATDGECNCQSICDLSTGICEFSGDCVGTFISEPGVFCTTDCVCNAEIAAAAAAAAAVTAAGTQTVQHNAQLAYSATNNNLQQVSTTGMLGTQTGTQPDSKQVFILDEKTLFTNEVHITPAWCH